MHINYRIFIKSGFVSSLTALAALALGGCYGSGSPSVAANPQTISFAAAPVPNIDVSTVTVSATASSGLPIRYSSITPSVCSVDTSTGVLTAMASGICTVAANQSGNSLYAPAPQATQNVTFTFSQTLIFGTAPSLSLYDLATVSATASSGFPVSYSSTTPAVCSVNRSNGLVTALSIGDCTVAAAAGTLQATQTIPVSPGTGPATVPAAPTGVTATAGNTSNTVIVNIGATVSGGSPITGFSVTSSPAGITASGATSPITVTCPSTCSGKAFAVTAANSVGSSLPSAPADVITGYNVTETFYEPDTQPRDSIFIGSFTFNATTGTVSNLGGILSESMTGDKIAYPNDTMTWLPLNYQLSAMPATLGGVNGLLVTTFKNTNTNTFWTGTGGDGWTPQAGVDVGGIYYGFPNPANNPGNAYAMIFVNTANPTAALTQSQIDKLAYADCAPDGMMGAVCMTGTTIAGYGAIGTMSGYPVSQVITRQQ